MNGDIRERVLSIAESWIATPYRHQGRRIHVGCDCLALSAHLAELYALNRELHAAIAPDWAERSGEIVDAGGIRHFGEPLPCEARPGDLLLFRWRLTVARSMPAS